MYEKFYTENLSKIYFLKNAKKICKPNNRDLNRDWINTKIETKKCADGVSLILILFSWTVTLFRTPYADKRC